MNSELLVESNGSCVKLHELMNFILGSQKKTIIIKSLIHEIDIK